MAAIEKSGIGVGGGDDRSIIRGVRVRYGCVIFRSYSISLRASETDVGSLIEDTGHQRRRCYQAREEREKAMGVVVAQSACRVGVVERSFVACRRGDVNWMQYG